MNAHRTTAIGDIGVSESSPAFRVLVAEDDEEMRRLLAQALCWKGAEVLEAADGLDLWRRFSAERHNGLDVVVTDVRMPGMSGLDALKAIRDVDEDMPVIVITAFGDYQTHHRARALGAVVIDKPFDVDALVSSIEELVDGI